MQRPVFAANWKMHHGPSDAQAFMRAFLTKVPRRNDRTFLFFPPTATLAAVAAELHSRREIFTGVQNIHWEDKGAFTGETSAVIARDAGARLALVGHSERRHLFGETDEQTALKCASAVRAGLIPLLCVGEKLDERERGDADEVVLRQLRAAMAELDADGAGGMLVAYEPVWAIGTGRTATPEDAAATHGVIRRELMERLGDRGKSIRILYGGSVNRGNVASLLAASNVDGVLVGGASLDAAGWAGLALT